MTREQLEKKLKAEATKLKLRGTRRQAYIYGTLNKMFPIEKKKLPALLRAQANPLRRKARVKKKTVRRKNPVQPANRQTKIEHAIKLFQRFRLSEPKHIDDVAAPECDVAMVIGTCDGILYTTKRNGKIEKYVHEFSARAKPILAASWDGKQIFVLGGKYNFTEQGITDEK